VSWKRTPVSWAVRSASRNTTTRRPCHRPARPRHPDLPPEVEVALLPTRPPWADRFDTCDEGERARYGVYALTRRAAEAATVRAAATSLLDGHGQEGRLIVLGDLNDGPDAATTQILYGPPGSEIGTDGFDQADRGDGQRLWNLAARIPEAQRFSRVYGGRGELIDHIPVSRALVNSVADGAVHTDGAGPTPSINDRPAERRNAAGSDHRPVIAQFDLWPRHRSTRGRPIGRGIRSWPWGRPRGTLWVTAGRETDGRVVEGATRPPVGAALCDNRSRSAAPSLVGMVLPHETVSSFAARLPVHEVAAFWSDVVHSLDFRSRGGPRGLSRRPVPRRRVQRSLDRRAALRVRNLHRLRPRVYVRLARIVAADHRHRRHVLRPPMVRRAHRRSRSRRAAAVPQRPLCPPAKSAPAHDVSPSSAPPATRGSPRASVRPSPRYRTS
jgi:hypothetical protein